jgi:hypothetical protein
MTINWFMALGSLLMLGASVQQYFWKGDWRLAMVYLTWCIGNAIMATATAK